MMMVSITLAAPAFAGPLLIYKPVAIGEVEVAPNTRVRLPATTPTDHRLDLAQGTSHASIWAPPRLFFVETPSAVAVDLGCEYTLAVDANGRGLLSVAFGWVAFGWQGHETIVPAGAMCETRPGIGPGTPYFGNVSETFRTALMQFDFDTDQTRGLSILLTETTPCEAFSLRHLLNRVDGAERGRIYNHLAGIITLPDDVTRDGIVQLDSEMMDSLGVLFEIDEFIPCLTPGAEM